MSRRKDMLRVGMWHVLGEEWRVRLVEEVDQAHSGGETRPDRGELLVPRALSPGARKKRLAHELVHAIGYDSEDAANAAEALVGLLVDHGVV